MPAARQWAYKRRRKIMGLRIRKSISFGKGFRVNLGKSGITSVTFGKRGAPHITTGRRGTRFGTPVVPGTGISYETRLDKPKTRQSRKESRKSTATAHEPDAVAQTSVIPTTLAEPGTGGNGNGEKSNGDGTVKTRKPFYKRWWFLVLAVLVVLTIIGSISTPSYDLPDTVGMNVAEAQQKLKGIGFTNVKVVGQTSDKTDIWKVKSQSPANGKQKASTAISLTVEKDLSKIPTLVKTGAKLTDVETLLAGYGYSAGDYSVKTDSGDNVSEQNDWSVVSVSNDDTPVITVHSEAADEAAKKKAEEEAEEEAARKAQEEAEAQKAKEEADRKAAEEAARQQAEQQKQAEAEQQRQAEQQQQQAQQQQQTQHQSTGTAHGGAFCSTEGARAQSDRSSNILTCKPASDGRLRWQN